MKKNESLNRLRKQIIITDPYDLVESCWLKGHPSVGKPDEVVWKFGFVLDNLKGFI